MDAANVASVTLSWLLVPFFPSPFVFYCRPLIPCDLQPEMEDNASMLLERARESVCVHGLGVWGREGGR